MLLSQNKQNHFPMRIPEQVQPVGRPCGTLMHYSTRDVKDMGKQMGYRSLEWNWLKVAMNTPIWVGVAEAEAKILNLLVNE